MAPGSVSLQEGLTVFHVYQVIVLAMFKLKEEKRGGGKKNKESLDAGSCSGTEICQTRQPWKLRQAKCKCR